MRRRTSFQPDLMTLEERWVPAVVGAYPDPVRTQLASSYATEAAESTNPVVFLGDSITYNWGSTTRSAPGSSEFQADFASVDAANFGISGDTTSNLLYRVDNGDLAGHPQVAVVMIGVNDLIGGSSPQQAASGISSVVDAIQAQSPSTRIVLLSVLPTRMAPFNAEVAATDALISSLGHQSGVTYLDLQSRFLGTDGAARSLLLGDAVHPDAAGYAIIASAIDSTVLGLLHPSTTATVPGSSTPATSTSKAASTATSATVDAGVVLFSIVPDVSTSHHKTVSGGLAVGPES